MRAAHPGALSDGVKDVAAPALQAAAAGRVREAWVLSESLGTTEADALGTSAEVGSVAV